MVHWLLFDFTDVILDVADATRFNVD
jgi:hypothetical protein